MSLWSIFLLVVTLFVNQVNAVAGEGVCATEDNGAIPVQVFAFDFDQTSTPSNAKNAQQILYKVTRKYRDGDTTVREKLDSEWKNFLSAAYKRGDDVTAETLDSLTHSNNQDKRKGLRTYLLRMDRIAKGTMKHILDNKKLKGITKGGLRTITRQIRLAPGLINTLRRFQNQPLDVISATVSKRTIEDVFNRYESSLNLVVHAAEMTFRGGVSTGGFTHEPLTPFDKARILGQLINDTADKTGYTVYVGDNYLDFLALLKADIGILIDYTKTTNDLVHAFGMKTIPLEAWRKIDAGCWHDGNNSGDTRPVIFTARSWDAIGQFIFGRDFQ